MWNTVLTSGLVHLVATWHCLISYKNGYAGLLVLPSLEPYANRQNKTSISLFSRYTLVDVHLNWPNWFNFLILEGGLLNILMDCIIFLSPFVDVTRMSKSTVSFLAQLDSGIICLWNGFL